jgi:hypothetical protein
LQSLLAINIKSMKTCVRLTLSRTTRPWLELPSQAYKIMQME